MIRSTYGFPSITRQAIKPQSIAAGHPTEAETMLKVVELGWGGTILETAFGAVFCWPLVGTASAGARLLNDWPWPLGIWTKKTAVGREIAVNPIDRMSRL